MSNSPKQSCEKMPRKHGTAANLQTDMSKISGHLTLKTRYPTGISPHCSKHLIMLIGVIRNIIRILLIMISFFLFG